MKHKTQHKMLFAPPIYDTPQSLAFFYAARPTPPLSLPILPAMLPKFEETEIYVVLVPLS